MAMSEMEKEHIEAKLHYLVNRLREHDERLDMLEHPDVA